MNKCKLPNFIVLIVIIYVLIFSTLSIVRHELFYTGWDLGLCEQIIWNTKEGNFFYSNEYNMNFLGHHFNLVFLLLMPVYYLLPYTHTLLILQTVAIATGAVIIFFLTKKVTNNKQTSKIMSIIYIMNPLLWHMNLADFHPIILFIPLFLIMILYLEKNELKKYWFFLFLTLLVKENVSLIIVFLGIFIYFFKKKTVGLKTILIGICWFIITINIIMPYLNSEHSNLEIKGEYDFFKDRYYYLGENIIEIGKTILTNPIYVLTYTDSYTKTNPSIKIKYSLLFLIWFACLPMYSIFTIVGIPIFLQNLLSVDSYQLCLTSHHNASLLIILFVSTIFGLSKIKKTVIYKKIIFSLILINLFLSVFIGLIPLISDNHSNLIYREECLVAFEIKPDQNNELQQSRKYIKQLFKDIPNNSTIACSEHTFPHLIKKGDVITVHEYGSSKEANIKHKDFVIIDTSDTLIFHYEVFLSTYEQRSFERRFGNSSFFIFKETI